MNRGYFALSYIENQFQPVASFLATFCWSINCMSWMCLNCKRYFRHFQKLKHHLYLRLINLFSYKESSILTINYVFSFSWSLNCTSLDWKLSISIRKILGFWAVLILEVFYCPIFENITFNSWSFFRCFSWPVNCTSWLFRNCKTKHYFF